LTLLKRDEGNWVGPTIILHTSSEDKTMCEEIFGPVLSVYVASSSEEAIEIENANPFGNAASIYTTNGGNAEWFLSRFSASVLRVNVGTPVPRCPFPSVACAEPRASMEIWISQVTPPRNSLRTGSRSPLA
jgi:acyl-CoA reductase-like NAD-dependent aldehyde dehydrogenase